MSKHSETLSKVWGLIGNPETLRLYQIAYYWKLNFLIDFIRTVDDGPNSRTPDKK